MVSEMVLQVVFILRHKYTLGTAEHLLRLDVAPAVLPELLLRDGDKLALLALEGLYLPLGVHSGNANFCFLKVFGGAVVFNLQVLYVD